MGNASARDAGAGAHGTSLDGYGNVVRSELQPHFGDFDTPFPHERAADSRGTPGGGGRRLSHADSSESMGNTPPESPNGSARMPLMFTPQVPMVPISKVNEIGYGLFGGRDYESQNQNGSSMEQGIPALFQWAYDGDDVYIEGSWDGWSNRVRLQKVGNEFSTVKVLPPGVYQFRFIVNGEVRCSPDFPFTSDKRGYVRNILDLQEHIPENVESISGFEPPRSPGASYDSPFPTVEDFSKEPPMLPPQLHYALLDSLENADGQGSLSRPQHVVLNHLYVEKGRAPQSVLALGLTHRFQAKYTTVVLYKPLHRGVENR